MVPIAMMTDPMNTGSPIGEMVEDVGIVSDEVSISDEVMFEVFCEEDVVEEDVTVEAVSVGWVTEESLVTPWNETVSAPKKTIFA